MKRFAILLLALSIVAPAYAQCAGCGQPCFEGTLGECTASGSCVPVNEFTDRQYCCVDEDCPKWLSCNNGMCSRPAGPFLTSMYISPSNARLSLGETTDFVATILDEHGEEIPGLTVEWSSTVGSIDSGGRFNASGPGKGTVSARVTYRDTERTASAPVTVGNDVVVEGAIADTDGNLLEGTIVVFTDTNVVLTTVRSEGGRYRMRIPQGMYRFFVGAKGCYLTAEETIDVASTMTRDFRLQKTTIDRVAIVPDSAVIEAGASVQLESRIFNPGNEEFWWAEDSSWTSSNPSIGTITDDGTVVAKTAGTTTVRFSARCGSETKEATAPVRVVPRGTFALKKCSEADRASTEGRIDYVLIPHSSYATIDEFKTDIEKNYLPRLFSTQPLSEQAGKFNFYYYDEKISCTGKDCRPDSTFWEKCPFANLAGIIHKGGWRDFASGFSFTANNPMTQVHEIGHALFDMADEYCCDGGYIESRHPYHNIFPSSQECERQLRENGIAGGCEKICDGFSCKSWYRQSGPSIMKRQDQSQEFSANNKLRINWFFREGRTSR